MIQVEELELCDVPLFKGTVKFPFKKGLTVLYGLNRSSSKNSKNGNAAGKSALVSQIQEILGERPSIGTRQDRLKEGSRSLSMSVRGQKVVASLKGSKQEVHVNGKSVARTSTLAKQWLKDNIPFANDDILNTTVYIDGRVGHPLVTGSAAERARFFTKFFNIDQFDQERKLIVKTASSLNEVSLKYNELLREYHKTKEQLNDIDSPESISASIKKLKSKLAKLQTLQDQRREANRIASFIDANKKAYRFLTKELAKGETFPSSTDALKKKLRSKIKEFEDGINDLEKSKSAIESYQRWKSSKDHYDKQIKKLSKDATKLLHSTKSIEKALGVSRRRYKKASELEQKLASIHVPDQPPEVPDSVEDPGTSLETVKLQIQDLTHKLEHASQFGKGLCPTCGQSVKMEASPKQMQKKLEKLRALEHKIRQYLEYESELSLYKRDLKLYKISKKSVQELTERLRPLGKARSVYLELRDLPDDPGSMEEVPNHLEGSFTEKLSRLHEGLSHLRVFVGNTDLVMSYRSLKNTDDLEDMSGKINRRNDRLSKLQASLEVFNLHAERLADMRKRLRTYRAQLKSKESVDLLLKAYNDKSMKKMAVQAIATHFTARLNKYAKLVFQEPFRFEVSWPSTSLQILVHRRNHGKRVLTSDVRKLSGAESKLFTLIVVLTLWTFRPAAQRASVLILDEPTANLSEESVETFKDFLQILMGLVPSVVIVTPRSGERYEGAHNMTVVKTRTGSILKEGHPWNLPQDQDGSSEQ